MMWLLWVIKSRRTVVLQSVFVSVVVVVFDHITYTNIHLRVNKASLMQLTRPLWYYGHFNHARGDTTKMISNKTDGGIGWWSASHINRQQRTCLDNLYGSTLKRVRAVRKVAGWVERGGRLENKCIWLDYFVCRLEHLIMVFDPVIWYYVDVQTFSYNHVLIKLSSFDTKQIMQIDWSGYWFFCIIFVSKVLCKNSENIKTKCFY